MANKSFHTPLLKPFQDAHDAWSDELVREYGKQACRARYDARGHGEEGSKLRKLHDAREAAMSAWLSSAY